MNALDEVPFQTMLGPLEDNLQLVTAPYIHVPDSRQILRDTEVRSQLVLALVEFSSLVSWCSSVDSIQMSLRCFEFNYWYGVKVVVAELK